MIEEMKRVVDVVFMVVVMLGVIVGFFKVV